MSFRRYISTLYSNIQSELGDIVLWCAAHKLTINIKKSKAILFTNKRDHEMADYVCHNVHLNGETVEQVPVYKYLRIQLDHDLKFNLVLKLLPSNL